MRTRSVSSVSQFVDAVVEVRDTWYPHERLPEVWFRGVCNSELALLPGAYWRTQCDEGSLVLSFRNLVPAYIEKEPSDEREWYYLMQHYGLPTRLLDWTESALIALYFATATQIPGKDPCVWMMDPVSLNRAAHGPQEEAIIVPVDMESDIRYWLSDYCGRGRVPHMFQPDSRFKDNRKPLAILPKRYNPRIVAQRGTFTVHGCDEKAIDQVLIEVGDAEPKIAKLVIAGVSAEQIRRDLWVLGINKSALFPEPQSVAEDLKQIYEIKDC